MEENHARAGFSEAAIWAMLAPIVETKPKFIGGSRSSIMLVDFFDFKGECLEHETNIPFFEIFDARFQGAYEHKIDGKIISSRPTDSGFSYYSNLIGYSFCCTQPVNSQLLGINPQLFQEIAKKHNLTETSLNGYQLNLSDPYIQIAIEQIIRYIRIEQSIGATVETQFFINYQTRLLVDALLNPLLRDFKPREDSYTSAIARVLEWIDSIIENWEELTLDEFLRVASVENNYDFIRAFERKTGKKVLKYYRERKLELIRQRRTKTLRTVPSIKTIEKVLELLYEQIDKIERCDRKKREQEALLLQISKKIGVELGSFKNACNSMKLQPYRYYRQQCLEYAKYLLLTTDYSVVKIAQQTGYTSDGLRNAIKKDCGCTPREFRKLFQ